MESIRQVEGELKRSEVKFRDFQRHSVNMMEQAAQLAQQVKDEIEQINSNNDSDSASSAIAHQRVQDKINTIKKLCKDYGEAHRDIHPTVSRIGRVIDKWFTSDLNLFAEPSQPLTSLDVIDSEPEPPSSSIQSITRQLMQFSQQSQQPGMNYEAVSALLQQLGSGPLAPHFGIDLDMPPNAVELYGYGDSGSRRDAEQQTSNPPAPVLTPAEEERKKEAYTERKQRALCEALVEHCYRHGMMDVGDQLCRDAKLDVNAAQRERYVVVNDIITALRQASLQPALAWAESHADELNQHGSLLELKLHRFRFIQLAAGGRRSELLAYARVFGKFQQKDQLREVQTLMGNLMFMPKEMQDALSQFETTLQPVLINELCETFIHDACQLQHMPSEGSLSIALKVGCQAIAPLLNFSNVVSGDSTRTSSAIWDASRPELPVEIPGARDYQFHSVFVCPILRQPTSSKNPPMRLVCGHAISREALNKLTSHMSSVARFKCPYCPKEQDPKEAKQIRF